MISLLLRVLLLGPIAWGSAALWFDGPASRLLAGALAAAYALTCLWLLFGAGPARRRAGAFLVLSTVVLLWWLSLEPSNAREWQPDVDRQATAEIDGDRLTLRNVRDFTYRSETDFDARWEDRTYDLSSVRGLDLFLCSWGPPHIAHTILSWEFADGRHLAISIETRKEQGESYSAIRGFFRQYELAYVVADERDVIGVRTNQRGEQVRLYRLRTPPDRARRLLLDYLERATRLAEHPAFYNAFTQNCTTTIFVHVFHIIGTIPWDWRIFVNGTIDELLYEEGVVNTEQAFERLRAASRIDEEARAVGAGLEFSARIREGLPARPPPP